MAKNSGQIVLIGMGFALTAVWLVSRPNCNRGCRTVAEHLFEHGVRDIILGL